MSAVIRIRSEYFIMSYCIRRIDQHFFVLIKKCFIPIVEQSFKHRTVSHVMPVNDRIRIFKISIVVILRKNRSFGLFFMIDRVIQIVCVVILPLENRIVYRRSRYTDPRIHIGILFL